MLLWQYYDDGWRQVTLHVALVYDDDDDDDDDVALVHDDDDDDDDDDGWRQVTLHVALVHSFVNPSLFIVLHRGIRQVDQIDFIGPKSDHCLALPVSH